MGKIHILTKEQRAIMAAVIKNDFLTSHFYFTGDTALSEFYLQHRYSDDLDFFCEEEFDTQIIANILETWSKKYGFTVKTHFVEIVYICNLIFKDGETLKLDFVHQKQKRVEKGITHKGLIVDSLRDIAINKLLTINQRTTIKDFVDLYFLLQRFTIWDLIDGLKIKYGIKTELFILSTDLMKIEDFDALPRMIAPLTLTALKKFYREKAKQLGLASVE